MKVSELLEMIKDCDHDADIFFEMSEGCCGDYRDLDLDEDLEVENGYVRLRFDAVPGYYSCRQVGVTVKAHNEYWKNKPEYQIK